MYEVRSGLELQDGIPTMFFVAMGMQEKNGNFGWYSEYSKEVYFENEMNTKQALFGVRKDSNILHLFLAVTIIGGFFFSIMWETKARYIFPYYIMMFSYAGMGYVELITQIQKMINRKRKIREKDNVIPFERVA